jgi:hypothetical protein
MRKLVAVLAAALAVAPAAGAGGFATVGVTPLPPEDGSGWTVVLMIKQHGRTPLDGLRPSITIRNPDTGTTKTYAARPTGNRPGEYTATVVFPSDGTWSYVIDDGFTRTHTFAPITIHGVGADGSFPTAVVAAAVALALALGALLALVARRRRLQPGLAATTH